MAPMHTNESPLQQRGKWFGAGQVPFTPTLGRCCVPISPGHWALETLYEKSYIYIYDGPNSTYIVDIQF